MGLIGLVEHYTTPPRRRGEQASSRGHKRLVHFMLRCEIISQAAAPARIATWERGPGPTAPTLADNAGRRRGKVMASLTIASKNYGSWSLRGWLLFKMAGLDFDEQQAKRDHPSPRART